MKIVIIGGSAAGMSFAYKYKRNCPEDQIVVIEKRDYVSFGACGLPYFVGDFFSDEAEMFSRTVEQVIADNIDLRIKHTVKQVNFDAKEVEIEGQDGIYLENYDRLIIASGASPIIPDFGTYDKKNVHTLVSLEDGHALREKFANPDIKNITIVGGGFIGLEVMEAAHKLDKNITLVEHATSILSRQFAPELTEIAHSHIREHDVNLLLDTGVVSIEDSKSGYIVNTTKASHNADLIVLCIGFRPNSQFVDLPKAKNGAIIIDEFSQTSVKDVYAVGDCALIKNKISNTFEYIALATVANKQGRMLADYLAGNETFFEGMLPSSCLKVLDYQMACTGLTEIQAKDLNLNYKVSHVVDKNQTSYYPGQEQVVARLIYMADTKVIIGAQMIGKKDIVGRINVLALAIDQKLTTQKLGYIDFCYSPPFARTWDILNVIGNVSK